MEALRQYDVHEATADFARILEQVAAGAEVVICRSGEPVAKVVPLRPPVKRTGRGSLRGQIHIAKDFDGLPQDTAGPFGVTPP